MKFPLVATAVISIGIVFSGGAHAVNVGINIGVPAPIVVAPAPVIVAGWHGDRYYDGHRYWERREWEEHQRHHGDHDRDHRRDRDEDGRHCPPGHQKKGEC